MGQIQINELPEALSAEDTDSRRSERRFLNILFFSKEASERPRMSCRRKCIPLKTAAEEALH